MFAAIKSRVKKLFKSAFNLTKIVVTISDIKKQFPKFDGRKQTHWFNLIDKLESKLNELVKPMTLSEFNSACHQLILDACKKYNCVAKDFGWVGGCDVTLQSKDANGIMRTVGVLYIGWHGDVSVSWNNSMQNKSCSNLNQGFRILLSMFNSKSMYS